MNDTFGSALLAGLAGAAISIIYFFFVMLKRFYMKAEDYLFLRKNRGLLRISLDGNSLDVTKRHDIIRRSMSMELIYRDGVSYLIDDVIEVNWPYKQSIRDELSVRVKYGIDPAEFTLALNKVAKLKLTSAIK